MKPIHCLLTGVCIALVACSGGGSKAIYHPDVGPFDENGDYVVALADAPVRKNIFSRSKTKKKEPAAKPAKPQRIAKVTRPKVEAPKVGAPQVTAPAAVARVAPPVPTRSAAPQTVLIAQSPRHAAQPVAVAQPQPRQVVAPKPAPKPKPKPVVAKTKKKSPVRHVVRKSDTLYGLSRKYGVSVSSIQRANSLRSSKIITGKTLLIPR